MDTSECSLDPACVKGDDHLPVCDKSNVRNNFIEKVPVKSEPSDSGLVSVVSNNSLSDSKNVKHGETEQCDAVCNDSTVKLVNHIDKSESDSDQEAPCLTKEEPFECNPKVEENGDVDKECPAINDGHNSEMSKEDDDDEESKEKSVEKSESSDAKSDSDIAKSDVLESKCDVTDSKPEDSDTRSNENQEVLNLSVCSLSREDTAEVSLTEQSFYEVSHLESEMEDEAYNRDEPPLHLSVDSQTELGRRCICISNIFRSLSCIPGNDVEMSKHAGLMRILGQLLLLHHNHLPRSKCHRKLVEKDCDPDHLVEVEVDSCEWKEEWYWSYLASLRENTLVIFANICGHLNLSLYSEKICFPILDGLLHWAVCPSSCARDPLPSMSPMSVLSPQRLVLEALCKLCIHDYNVDLLLATPPYERIIDLLSNSCKLFSNRKEQVPRELALVLLSELVQGDTSAARAIALQHPCISLLIDFLETAEQNAMQVANTQGISALQCNPEVMGTSLDMLRRAGSILLALARVEENRKLFVHHQSRLLALVMSQILDQSVAQILSDVLFECSLFS